MSGLFSAGHTGATVVAAVAGLGLLPGVDRPALAAHSRPRAAGRAARRRRHRRLQARAPAAVRGDGRIYAQVARRATPRVGLLTMGEEETKGNELTGGARAAQGARLNFVGNVEGHDLFAGKADVVVCDGFTGNVALKVSEGLVEPSLTCCARSCVGRSARLGGAAGAAGVPALRAARRLLRVRRGAAARGQRAVPDRPRPVVGAGRAQRRRAGRRFRASAGPRLIDAVARLTPASQGALPS